MWRLKLVSVAGWRLCMEAALTGGNGGPHTHHAGSPSTGATAPTSPVHGAASARRARRGGPSGPDDHGAGRDAGAAAMAGPVTYAVQGGGLAGHVRGCPAHVLCSTVASGDHGLFDACIGRNAATAGGGTARPRKLGRGLVRMCLVLARTA